MRRAFLLFFLLYHLFSYKAFSQKASFSLPENACIDENISLSKDINAIGQNFQWDFCPTSFTNPSSIENVVNLENANKANAVTIVYDSLKWYGFVSNRGKS